MVSSYLFAQEISEPEFIGEAKIIIADSMEINLPIETAMIKARANASLYIFGMGNIKSVFYLNGAISSARIPNSDDFYILVRTDDNRHSPSAYIKIFRFDVKPDRRQAEWSSLGTFTGASANNLSYVPFVAKKYGDSSYLIKLTEPTTGEYGIKLSTENNTILTFGISGSADKVQEYVSYIIENDIYLESYDADGNSTIYDVPSKKHISKDVMTQIYGKEFVNNLKSLYREQLDAALTQEWEQRKQERANKKKEKSEQKAKGKKE